MAHKNDYPLLYQGLTHVNRPENQRWCIAQRPKMIRRDIVRVRWSMVKGDDDSLDQHYTIYRQGTANQTQIDLDETVPF